MRGLLTHWQVGDGREARLADYVIRHARPGDASHVIQVIDDYCYNESFMINVGDVKGRILDDAILKANPTCILELGTYCGYSALRMAVAAPAAKVLSVEFNPANAEIAQRILVHAGVGDRVTIVVGTLGDGGKTLRTLNNEHGCAPGAVDVAFLDHHHDAYLPDLKLILEQRWLRRGALVVADNIKIPGAREYSTYMSQEEGIRWQTTAHQTLLEYQSVLTDLVLVSEYRG